ncbi:MAG TPA: DUF2071 domain-containing protein [Ktedonobacteraceae bacterium]|nr:DUF2071 domain-containing protein [Ktedonobacteraceae bacterium]
MDANTLLQTVEHRAYPVSRGPWIMTQTWHELLFSHWPLPPAQLRSLIPPQLEIDTFEREAWLGIVPFRMSNVHPRAFPSVPGLSQFPELNVRTYVVADGRPGVYFFSLDAGNPLAVALARSLFHLPYYRARMRCQREGDIIYYTSQRTHHGARPADYEARYRPSGPVISAAPGSIEHWLTERYYLYTVFHEHLYRGDIHHVLWPLQVAELEALQDTMALAHDIQLPATRPLLHYAERQEVLIWALRRL